MTASKVIETETAKSSPHVFSVNLERLTNKYHITQAQLDDLKNQAREVSTLIQPDNELTHPLSLESLESSPRVRNPTKDRIGWEEKDAERRRKRFGPLAGPGAKSKLAGDIVRTAHKIKELAGKGADAISSTGDNIADVLFRSKELVQARKLEALQRDPCVLE